MKALYVVMRGYRRGLVLLAGLLWLGIAQAGSIAHDNARIVAKYPHDPGAFTQGLVIDHGTLYESAGGYGYSSLRRVALASGRVVAKRALSADYFAEGLALAGARLYQLTWKAGRVFVYDRKSLRRIDEYRYTGQGWGLTWDGAHLIMSDGSATLRVIDRQGFSVVRRIRVTENARPIDQLNELEYIDGEIWANVWQEDRIVRIDPSDGHVVGVIDASKLRAALGSADDANVLNGIAWDAAAQRVYLTGKYWPCLFEIAWPTAQAAAQ